MRDESDKGKRHASTKSENVLDPCVLGCLENGLNGARLDIGAREMQDGVNTMRCLTKAGEFETAVGG
jgi:hypothetical protein